MSSSGHPVEHVALLPLAMSVCWLGLERSGQKQGFVSPPWGHDHEHTISAREVSSIHLDYLPASFLLQSSALSSVAATFHT